MARNPLAAVEYLDGARRDAGLNIDQRDDLNQSRVAAIAIPAA
jgi:hypothetical protein